MVDTKVIENTDQLYYYNGQVYDISDQPGQLVISSVLGNISKRYKHLPGKQVVDVYWLPIGLYIAAIKSKHILFIKN